MKGKKQVMTEKDFERFENCMRSLSLAFQGEVSDEKVALYFEMLKDEEISIIEDAVISMIKTRKERFFPTVAEIIEEINFVKEGGW
ncbi:MAG: hypothetical protein D6726_12820 [Nitrospirae bacterium]|nr:MAG: hypothetical protein D6726_12820 [Nitrospirota bacterium]